MCTFAFHFSTAQILQGSRSALGDFPLLEEPRYAIEEVLSKIRVGMCAFSLTPRTAGQAPLSLQLLGGCGPPLALSGRAGREQGLLSASASIERVAHGLC